MSEELNIVLIGCTRSGKTSFANTFSGQSQWGQVGTDDDESTTSEVRVCEANVNGKRVNIFDTPGMNDSRLAVSNSRIKHDIELFLINSLQTSIDGFLLVESLQGDSVTVRRNATALVEIFGPDVMKSCLVLLTKTASSASKMTSYQNVCTSMGCPFVLWENNHKDDVTDQWVNVETSAMETQKNELFAALGSLPKFQLSNLQAMKDEIMKRAATLRDQHPVQYETVTTVIDVPYIEQEVVKVTKQRPVIKQRWKKGRFGKITGLKENYTVWENYQEDQVIQHQRVRQENRQNSVAVPKPPVDYFVPTAKKQIIDTFKSTFSVKN